MEEKIQKALNEEKIPRYQQSLAESYEPPTVFSQEARKVSHIKTKEQIVALYQSLHENDYFSAHGFSMSGSQKRQLRRKLEKMFDKGKLKLADLNA